MRAGFNSSIQFKELLGNATTFKNSPPDLTQMPIGRTVVSGEQGNITSEKKYFNTSFDDCVCVYSYGTCCKNGISRQSSSYLRGRKSSIPSLRVSRVYRTDMDKKMPWTNLFQHIPSFPHSILIIGITSSLIGNTVPLIFSVLTMKYYAHSMLINLLVWMQSQLLY